ncbi:PQQ-binding-like beta-propeller repeat protein [Actinoplanes sp. NPDC049596]|uniref:PQQ-binding-like beta-propeller repeat protein n=1 Tax=unclassified Actinoplanes TaxID=2626549 RepID=UPI00342AEF47
MLDDLLTQVGRDADAIPLSGPASARQRGRQRTRRQATISAALAVTLVAVGVGLALTRPHDDLDRTIAPTPSAPVLPEVGSPVELGARPTSVAQAAGDGKVFSAWQTPDGATFVNAVDLHTGAVLWTKPMETTGAVADVRLVPGAVVIIRDAPQGPGQGLTVSYADPATGQSRRQFRVKAGHEVSPAATVLVDRWDTGEVEAGSVATGAPAWSDTTNKTTRVISDGERLVQVTTDGRLLVRETGTGTLRRTITPALKPNEHGQSQFVIAGDRLFFDTVPCCDGAAYQIVSTDLATGDSSVVLSQGPERLVGMTACGDQRLCVLDDTPQVTAIDLGSKVRLWQSPAPESAGMISAIGDSTLITGGGPAVVLDGGGQPAFRAPDANVDWLDEDTVLMTPRLTAGTVTTVNIIDRKVTRLGEMPATIGNCVHTTDRLACPTATSLRLWSLTG